MKVNFWSSTEYSGFLEGLMRELTEAGLSAEQRFQISEKSYRSAKSTPARLFLRFRQYVVYPTQLGVALLARRVLSFKLLGFRGNRSDEHLASDSCPLSSECIVVSTNTFYAPLLATYLHPNVVHLVYDLFPEAMIHSGKWTEGTLKVRLVRWITKQTLKRAKTNVFLGERLKDYVESIHGAVPNSAIIAVGADQALFERSPRERLGHADVARQCVDGKPEVCPEGVTEQILKETDSSNSKLELESSLTILYCGNFGNMHDSETLFRLWKSVSELIEDSKLKIKDTGSELSGISDLKSAISSKIAWKFCCSGPKRAELESVREAFPDVLKNQIQLGGGLDQTAWIATMESADVALVTMVPGSETVVMPSKTYSAMMAGQAILAIAPEDSDLVDTIKAADCGWFVEPGDVDGLESALQAMTSAPEALLEKRENAFAYAHQHFGQDALAREWQGELAQRV
jgi:glycosyltransferase involved in cell wall biosynthesis